MPLLFVMRLMLHGLARKSKIGKRLRTANEQILGLSVDVVRACLLLIGKSSSCCVGVMVRFYHWQPIQLRRYAPLRRAPQFVHPDTPWTPCSGRILFTYPTSV
jgi:hypothetical protein